MLQEQGWGKVRTEGIIPPPPLLLVSKQGRENGEACRRGCWLWCFARRRLEGSWGRRSRQPGAKGGLEVFAAVVTVSQSL